MRLGENHNSRCNYVCVIAAWLAGIITLYIFNTGGVWEPTGAVFIYILRCIEDEKELQDYIDERINRRDRCATEELLGRATE